MIPNILNGMPVASKMNFAPEFVLDFSSISEGNSVLVWRVTWHCCKALQYVSPIQMVDNLLESVLYCMPDHRAPSMQQGLQWIFCAGSTTVGQPGTPSTGLPISGCDESVMIYPGCYEPYPHQ